MQSQPKQGADRNGVIFTLPHPILFQRTSPFSPGSQQNGDPETSNSNFPPQKKWAKRLKEKGKDSQQMQPIVEFSSYDPNPVLRQTLYRRFMEHSKYQDASTNSKCDKQKKSKPNIKLRQMNLVVLSKREQLKREIQSKLDKPKKKELTHQEKRGQKHRSPRECHAGILPRFARSKSSFYRSKNEYNTLALLTKTIFSDIDTNYTAHFQKQKAMEPMELGIRKINIEDKNSSRHRRKNVIQHDLFKRQFNSKVNSLDIINTLLAVDRTKRKQNDLSWGRESSFRGWEQDLNEYNIAIPE